MADPRWFEVDLGTLALSPAAITDWPGGMPASSRMQEECLESLVALNLEALFPDEGLLLVNTQHQIMNVADVLAVDPVGWVRVMELKREPARRGDLEDQVVSYALHRQCQRPWPDLLAGVLPELPERIALALDAFRLNRRVKSLGGQYVAGRGYDAGRWDDKDRFQKAKLLCDCLRQEAGQPPAPAPIRRDDIVVISRRLYGVAPTDLTLTDPAAALATVVTRWCGYAPPAAGREFTLIAPRLAQAGEDPGRLERRGAFFHLIDAELRHESAGRVVRRAVLRWGPIRRTAAADDFRTAARLAAALRGVYPDVPLPKFDLLDAGKRRWWYWHEEDRFSLNAVTDAQGRPVLATASWWVTEGFADLRQPRADGLRAIVRELQPVGSRQFGGSSEICVPLGGDFRPAADLAAAYYHLLECLGCFVPFRWNRRPGTA